GLVGSDDDLGDVRGAGQLVEFHVRVEHPTGGRIDDLLLEQAVVQAADDAAVDLTLPGQLVEDQARVLDGDDLFDLHHSGLDVEPPEAWPGGKLELPIFEMMSVGWRPRISAAMMARIVRAPVPMSWVADLSSTDPSGLIVQETCLPRAAPPPQRCRAMPSP